MFRNHKFQLFQVLANVLSPNNRDLKTFSDWNAMHGQREVELTSKDSDSDHPMIKEIRKRTTEAMEEFDELGFL
jgi:hypothetical protein